MLEALHLDEHPHKLFTEKKSGKKRPHTEVLRYNPQLSLLKSKDSSPKPKSFYPTTTDEESSEDLSEKIIKVDDDPPPKPVVETKPEKPKISVIIPQKKTPQITKLPTPKPLESEEEEVFESDVDKVPPKDLELKELIKSPSNPVIIQTWKVPSPTISATQWSDEEPQIAPSPGIRTVSAESEEEEKAPVPKTPTTPEFSYSTRKTIFNSDDEFSPVPKVSSPSNSPSLARKLEPTYLPSMSMDIPRRRISPKRM